MDDDRQPTHLKPVKSAHEDKSQWDCSRWPSGRLPGVALAALLSIAFLCMVRRGQDASWTFSTNGAVRGGSSANGVAAGTLDSQSGLHKGRKLREVNGGSSLADLIASNQLLEAELAAANARLAAAQSHLATMLHTSAKKNRLMEAALHAKEGFPPTQEGEEENDDEEIVLAGTLFKFRELVGKKGKEGGGPSEPDPTPTQKLTKKVHGIIGKCLEVEEAAREGLKDLNVAWQEWSTGVREARWRAMVFRQVSWLASQSEYWVQLAAQGVTDAASATNHINKLEGEEQQNFGKFLEAYLPNHQWWDPSNPENVPELDRWQQEAQGRLEFLATMKTDAEKKYTSLEKELFDRCQMRIAGWNWTQVHDQALKDEKETDGKSPKSVDPAVRSQEGLKTPEISWKLHPRLYPNPTLNVTLMLQYYKQPTMIELIVDRLYKCTEGHLGRGQLPGVTTELMVNVDEPEEIQAWYDMWRKTANGSFVVPVFNHNVHENRGYNNLANMARGQILILIQDDDVPPESCMWLDRILRVYATWPNMGVVGLQKGRLSSDGFVWSTPLAFLRPGSDAIMNNLYDPATNVRMYFASVVDVGPMAVKRSMWVEMGGLPEDFCRAGESCIMADWQFVFRSWLAGYQVVHLFSPEDSRWGQGAEGGTHKAGYGFSSRIQNMEVNTEVYFDSYVKPLTRRLEKEVKRLNGYMRPVPMWE